MTRDEKLEIMRGMVLMRALDNRLKQFYLQGEVKYGGVAVPGQRVPVARAGSDLRRRHPAAPRRGVSRRPTAAGDGTSSARSSATSAPSSRCVPTPMHVRMVLNAQMGKAGPPMDGKDLHVGDFAWGILPPTAPLGISTMTIAGIAMAFAREGSRRVAVSFIGEGGSSLGEWHEAINLCAARRLPAIFCIQNNQTALSTPVREQSAVRVFADKAAGYGMPGITVDGTDPDAIAAAFTWAADRARAGMGPALIEARAMRMCGHAHHDDMLYLGQGAGALLGLSAARRQAAMPTASCTSSGRDAIRSPAMPRCSRRRLIVARRPRAIQDATLSDSSRRRRGRSIDAPWPEPAGAGAGVFADEPPRVRVEAARSASAAQTSTSTRRSRRSMPGLPFDAKGRPFSKR